MSLEAGPLKNLADIVATKKAYWWRNASDLRVDLHELKSVIEREDLAPPRLRLLRDNQYHDPRVFKGVANGAIRLGADFETVKGNVLRDSTLVIDNITPLFAKLAEFCDLVGELMGRVCPGNVYCATVPESGFGAHADQHDVLVVQLKGCKHWKIESTDSELRDLLIREGDILFIKEGTIHNVNSVGEISIHISISLS